MDVSSAPGDDAFAAVAPLGVTFQALTASGPVDAFTVQCPLSTEVKIWLEDKYNTNTVEELFFANIEYLECKLVVTNSSVGPVSISIFQDLMDWVLPEVVLKGLNELLKFGLTIPPVGGISLHNSSVLFGADYAIINADVSVNMSALLPPLQEVVLQSGSASSIAEAAAQGGVASTQIPLGHEGSEGRPPAVVYHGLKVHVPASEEPLVLLKEGRALRGGA